MVNLVKENNNAFEKHCYSHTDPAALYRLSAYIYCEIKKKKLE